LNAHNESSSLKLLADMRQKTDYHNTTCAIRRQIVAKQQHSALNFVRKKDYWLDISQAKIIFLFYKQKDIFIFQYI